MQDASRASRMLMRTGAALLELGRFAAVLSHAAQYNVGPLVYGHTGFLRPDGQVCSPLLPSPFPKQAQESQASQEPDRDCVSSSLA